MSESKINKTNEKGKREKVNTYKISKINQDQVNRNNILLFYYISLCILKREYRSSFWVKTREGLIIFPTWENGTVFAGKLSYSDDARGKKIIIM